MPFYTISDEALFQKAIAKTKANGSCAINVLAHATKHIQKENPEDNKGTRLN